MVTKRTQLYATYSVLFMYTDNMILCCIITDSSCSEGSVTVMSDVNNSSLQLVEMCSSEGVWSPVCNNNWTLQDAIVVCRELEKQGT